MTTFNTREDVRNYQLLKDVRELVAFRCLRGAYATREDGTACNIKDADAKCFCTYAACNRVAADTTEQKALQFLIKDGDPRTISYIHDISTHEENVSRIDRAIGKIKLRLAQNDDYKAES